MPGVIQGRGVGLSGSVKATALPQKGARALSVELLGRDREVPHDAATWNSHSVWVALQGVCHGKATG